MSVFTLANSLAGFFKVRYLHEKAVIDNGVFRLHYRLTSSALFLACIFLTAKELIGSPIQCIITNSKSDDTAKAVTTYCWVTKTFTIPGYFNKRVGVDVISPGVGNDLGFDRGEQRFHAYYQWVPFMLFFQGLLFYLPHWLWKNWEDGTMDKLTDGLRGTQIGPKESRLERQSRVVQYFVNSFHTHNVYAIGYFFCEILNLINVIANMFLIDKFLGGTFFTYGLDVLNLMGMEQAERDDPMITVFPRLTKCLFYEYGSSGSLMKIDALCVLALNVINEKIYIFLWFWLIMLAIFSALTLALNGVVCYSPVMREQALKRRFNINTSRGISALVRNTQIGDFLLLHLMEKNLSLMVYVELLDEICYKLHLNDDEIVTKPSTIKCSPFYNNDKLQLHQENETYKNQKF